MHSLSEKKEWLIKEHIHECCSRRIMLLKKKPTKLKKKKLLLSNIASSKPIKIVSKVSSFKKKKHIWSFWFYSLQGPFSVKICQKLAFSWLRKKAFLTSFGGKLDAGNAKLDITIMWEREWNTFLWFLNHFYVKKENVSGTRLYDF